MSGGLEVDMLTSVNKKSTYHVVSYAFEQGIIEWLNQVVTQLSHGGWMTRKIIQGVRKLAQLKVEVLGHPSIPSPLA